MKWLWYILVFVVILGCFFTDLWVFLPGFSPPREPQLQMQLMTRKDVYFTGDPIIIDVFIFNSGKESIHFCPIRLCYPFAESPDKVGIYFDATAANLVARPQKILCVASAWGYSLAPGNTYMKTICLQDCIIQPKPGNYSLPYTIAIDTLSLKDDKDARSGNRLAQREDVEIKTLFPHPIVTGENCIVNKGELFFSVRPREN